MHVVLFYHSLVSDWNHGNAHFLRGTVRELRRRGHTVSVYEPSDGWSRRNLLEDRGPAALKGFHRAYPGLHSHTYSLDSIQLAPILEGADLVIVHEWTDPALVRRIGTHRAAHGGFKLLFHDTHHRAITSPEALDQYDLEHYDGVLAFGQLLREVYLRKNLADNVWVWHEAADTTVFRPRPGECRGDVVWVGNWGDEERTAELETFLFGPVRALGLRAAIHGVRYPEAARARLREAGIDYEGWIANYDVPDVFGQFRFTVHIPRRPYREQLAGIPTIRVFEALACGIPLICASWEDIEGLFTPGEDFLIARGETEMREFMQLLLSDPPFAERLAAHGRKTILARHTCAHRVDELIHICAELGIARREIEVQ